MRWLLETPFPLYAAAALYLWVASAYWMVGRPWMTLAFLAYGAANIAFAMEWK